MTFIEHATTDRFTVVHGGEEGTQRRAAVLDDDGVIAAVALVPADWAEQDPATRWQPDGDVVLLELDEEALAVPGARRVDGGWLTPEPEPEPEPAAEPADPPATGPGPLAALVDALRALTPAQAEQLQQALTADPLAVT